MMMGDMMDDMSSLNLKNASVAVAIASYTRAAHIPLIAGSNSLVLITFNHVNALDTPDNYAIAALSTADLLIGLVYTPLVLMESYDKDIFNRSHFSCMFDFPFRFFLLVLSMSFMMLLTVDRYTAIAHPFYYNENVTNAKIVRRAFSLVVLNLVLFVGLLGFLVWQLPYTDGEMVNCSQSLIPDWFFILASIVVCIQELISIVCTILVSIDAWRSLRNREVVQKRFVERERILKVKNQLKMTISMNFLFVVLVMPSLIGPWLARKHANMKDARIVVAICTHFLLLNSSTNALVYALSRPIYRYSFVYILTHAPCKWGELSHYVMRLNALKAQDQSRFSTCSTSQSTLSVNVTPNTKVTNKFNKKYESDALLVEFVRKQSERGKSDKELEKGKTVKERTQVGSSVDSEDFLHMRQLRPSINTETTVTGTTVTGTSTTLTGTEGTTTTATETTTGTTTETTTTFLSFDSKRSSKLIARGERRKISGTTDTWTDTTTTESTAEPTWSRIIKRREERRKSKRSSK